jgi:hypothetical protein
MLCSISTKSMTRHSDSISHSGRINRNSQPAIGIELEMNRRKVVVDHQES